MRQALSVRRSASAVALLLALAFSRAPAQQSASGDLTGLVVGNGEKPVRGATVHIVRLDGFHATDVISDSSGIFVVRGVAPGLYRLTARRLGFRAAQLTSFRVVAGQTASVRVVLTASATQLSTVEVRVGPTEIDSRSTEIAQQIRVDDVKLVPMGRTATDLVALVPGATRDFVYGGAGAAANNYQLDGIAMSHPGTGGDFFAPSIDWIEALEVKGLGAGAESGDFQGAIINAITKTGTNKFQGAFRTNYIAPSLTLTNILPNEEGAEQTMRREFSGELRGPLIKDRLHYFVGVILVDRDVQVPNLTTIDQNDFRSVQQNFRDARGIAKLTFLPSARDRIDALGSFTRGKVEHADITGLDDPSSSTKVASPTTVYELGWTHTGITSSLNARVAGFNANESRLGYEGDAVPGIQVYRLGRQPHFQNSTFNERLKPTSIGGNLTYNKETSFAGASNKLVVGADYRRGTFRETRTRNGGLTWFPYVDQKTGLIDVTNAKSWPDVANEWGGEIHLDADVEDAAVFVQDYLTPIPNLTISGGARWGRWSGYLTPVDTAGGRFLAARSQAVDPRIGISWDISGRNDFVVKAHFGRYHQGMNSVFFDRAKGAAVYSNERFYLQGPELTDPRQVFTPAQRDANLNTFTGFSPNPLESILNEAGRVENYRQPYVDQWLLSAEKKFGPRWKAGISYVNRVNRNIVGLVDRNRASNYSIFRNVAVRDRATSQPVYDEFGGELTLPVVYVANNDLRNELIRRRDNLGRQIPPPPGYTFADINTLTWNPDIVLTTVPGARRTYDQASVTLRTEQIGWNGSLSVTATRLEGTIGGITGFGTTGTTFSAGSGVRPNEGINLEGRLPNVPAFDVKLWLSGNLIYNFRGGIFGTYSLGEYLTPTFQFTPRFRLLSSDRALLVDELFHGVLGQTINLEARGARKYPGHSNIDLRIERLFARSFSITADLFNAFASNSIVERNLTVNDGVTNDATSVFGAPRRRVNPLALQVGLRVEF
ncbi:MAG: carboxypeptidase regulatory-like domain-containing protein [Gemmatimonadaceae bacterium]